MLRFKTVLLLALGVGFLLIPVADAKESRNNGESHFLFHVDAGATWEQEEIPLTKGKSITSLCVSVRIVDQYSSQPLGSGKVCLSGQNKQKEAISKGDLTIYMNLDTNGTLNFSLPDATVVNLTKAMATSSRYHLIVISVASRKGTNSVLSGTGKYQGAHGTVEAFGILDTIGIEPKQTVSKYPVLGDIPILGALFRSTANKK